MARTHARTMVMVRPQGEAEEDDRAELMEDSQLLLNYRHSPWVGEELAVPDALSKGPQPGDRAPDVGGLRRTGVGRPLRLFDLLRGTAHTLFLYLDRRGEQALSDDDTRHLAEIVAARRGRYGASLVAYAITAPGYAPAMVEGWPTVQDAAGEFQRLYDVAAMSAYLVRPDGYVGYRAHPLRLNRLDVYLRRIFGERSP